MKSSISLRYFQGIELSELEIKLEDSGRACQVQEGATRADIREFGERIPSTTDSSKCFRACMFEAFGAVCYQCLRFISMVRTLNEYYFSFQLKDGQINIDKIVEFNAQDPAFESDNFDVFRKVSEECKETIAGLTRCDAVAKYVECRRQKMNTRRGVQTKNYVM